MKVLAASILALTVTLTTLPRPLQDPRDQGQDDETVVVGSSEVLLDAVVKDKKGVVRDLKPSDFEVYEDGVKQEIRSFRLVTRGPAAAGKADGKPNGRPDDKATSGAAATSPSAPSSSAPARPSRENPLSAVALVFDRLSPESRARARDAALAYVGNESRPDDFMGVFSIDLKLRAVQPFTSDARLVRQAVERVGARGSTPYASGGEPAGDRANKQMAAPTTDNFSGSGLAGTGEASGGNVGPEAGASAAEAQFAEMTRRAVEGFEILERGQQGFATTDALLAVINAMGRLPRRKALIFFSEGVAIPTAVQSQFRSVISAANRANVSIYAVDAAGLRVLSADAEAGRAMQALGRRRIAVAGSPSDGSGPMTRDLERNEDLMNQNPEGGLKELAGGTGGLFISNTNNPGPRLRQVDEDLHAYYLLSYSPRNQNFDGQFRQISLKVNRPGVEVQARKGYFALNTSYDTPVLHYEVPALVLLGSERPPPSAFDSRVAAFNFPEPGNAGLVPVMVEVSAGSINYVVGKDKKSYATNFSVVVLVKDEAGRPVRKLSNQYVLGGPLEQLDAARRGKILFYRETRLEPGRYTVAAVVHDATNDRASMQASALEVPAGDDSRLRLSSIVLIKSAEQATAADKQSPNPFHFGEVLIYPNMNEPVRKAASKNLAFFVTVYPPHASATPAKLKLEIMQAGRTLGQASYDLPAPDAYGRVQYATAVPIDKFGPGDYELRVTVHDARDTATRTEKFTIAP
ncbi:MAG TPA: VWA domain-containing protein [Pyrinomonadaceae bacterium]|jgi:VWFA-related protein|nr:VWA domain-containing protein [Pyrinomonadaceae bacterium]